jgi:hypothetical protein
MFEPNAGLVAAAFASILALLSPALAAAENPATELEALTVEVIGMSVDRGDTDFEQFEQEADATKDLGWRRKSIPGTDTTESISPIRSRSASGCTSPRPAATTGRG